MKRRKLSRKRPKYKDQDAMNKVMDEVLDRVYSEDRLKDIIDPEIDKNAVVVSRYPDQKCVVPGCKNNAVGTGDVCKKHGGDPLDRSSLIPAELLPDNMLGSYDPAFHPIQFIALAKEGKSEVEIAAIFEVSIFTMRGWAEKHLEFNTAYEVGQAMHEAWWLQQGKENLDNRSYNVGLFKFLTGNTLGWADKQESKNLNVTAGVLVAPKPVSEDEWEKQNG